MVCNIPLPRTEINAFRRHHHIRRLSLFGSVLRNDFGPDSDIDVLVEFAAGHTPGFAFITFQDELSEILGRKVDLNTPQCLSRYFRDQVLAEAEVLYDAP
jgi:predicted nucleotidyltransferase